MLCRVSPVSLIPIHQATRVSAVGWGTTLEAYATHCLTSSTRSTVKLWCSGSLEAICSDRRSGLKLKSNHTYSALSMSAPAKAKFHNWWGEQFDGLPV